MLALAGCGGGEGSSAESYANDVCEDMKVWVSALADADTRLSESGLSASALEDVAADVKDPSETLAGEIDQLRPPEAKDGELVHRKVDEFAAAVREHATVINQTLDADLGLAARIETVAVVVTSAAKMGRSLLDELRLLGPRGELADAFRDSSECESLSSRMPEVGS